MMIRASLKQLAVGAVLVSSASAMAGIECTALKREITGENQVQETKLPLLVIEGKDSYAILGAKIGDREFVVTPLQNGDYLASITVAPDYTQGLIVTTAFTSDKRFQISTVDGSLVYKLECLQK